MLQRAASNAYSWWWASHVRTKQSKWLEQSLQDMEEQVQHVLKLIEKDGDSFARRAEMYYKSRPELLNFVEESYRAYRALAERYDHLSTELQNANNTIASLCPDQIALMDEDDEYYPRPRNFPQVPIANPATVPKVPKAPIRDWKGLVTASKQMTKVKKQAKAIEAKIEVPKSGLNKTEACEEIDKLQKDILALQTVKEFVKSSYETGLSKYWSIENQITELQERVCSLEDEFGAGKVIEDDEARRLMAEAAIKSCQETLDQLQEKQEKYGKEATEEHKKIEIARQKLKSIKREFIRDQADEDVESKKAEDSQSSNKDPDHVVREKQEINVTKEKIKEHFEVGPLASFTVSELAEKIDELVNKVISLETSVSSQTVLMDRLRAEADDLHAQIRTLEEYKASMASDAQHLISKLKKVEEKLLGIEDLDRNVEKQISTLQTHFDEARSSLDHLSEKLSSVKSDEEPEATISSLTNEDKKEEEAVKDVEKKEKMVHENGKEEAVMGVEKKEKIVHENGKEEAVMDAEKKEKIVHENGKEEAVKDAEKKVDAEKKEKKVDENGKEEAVKDAEKKEKTANENGKEAVKDIEKNEKIVHENGKEEAVKDAEKKEKIVHENGKEEEANTSGRDDVKDKKDQHDSGGASVINQEEDVKSAGKKTVTFLDPISKDLLSEQKPKPAGDAAPGKNDLQEETETEDEFNWQQMLLRGLEDKEKILLLEYTTILRNYKELKKQLNDIEKKEKDRDFDVALQINDLKTAIAKRDEEIHYLRQRLNVGEDSSNTKEDHQATSSDSIAKPEHMGIHLIKKEDEDLKLIFTHQPHVMSQVEEKLRTDIDAILDENLEFWLKFSTSFHQIQKFKTTVHDLENEISKIKEKKKQEGSNAGGDTRSEVRPIYKHLKEIQAELTVWLDQSVLLKEELQRRFSSLCNIQEKITVALKEGVEEDEIRFSSHQAAKFQGEVLNMKQENNKVREELQAGVDHVTTLQDDIDKALKNLGDEFDLNDQQLLRRSMSGRSRVPLRSFIFGTKPKKQKHSIFSCVHPNKKYQVLRAGIPF